MPFGASTAPPSIVGHMVLTVPPKAEETIMTMRSPSGIHPAYQHGSDADVGNQILDPDTISDLGDVRPAVGALHANQAHSGDMGATSLGATQRGLWHWQSSGTVRAAEPVLNSNECSSTRDPHVGLQQLHGQSIELPQAEPILWRRSASGQALLTSLSLSTGSAQALAPPVVSELNPPSPSHHLQPILRLALP